MYFRNNYAYLSNFYLCSILYKGINYPSVENAFQAAKCLNVSDVKLFTFLSPIKAKVAGKEVTLRPDWNNVKLTIMEDLVRIKFQQPFLKEKLKKLIGYIEETNNWHDNYWGACKCASCINKRKLNHLGFILMKIRGEINES
jgi:ribA/ribD-fused uncharacterized protein